MKYSSQDGSFKGQMKNEKNGARQSERFGDGDGDHNHNYNQNHETTLRRHDLMAGARPKPIVPKSISEAYRIAQAICAAKMAPKGLDTPEACMIAIMHGLELGLSPLSALQRIAVINGRPTIWGDGALALVKASGLCEAIDEWIEGEKPETWVAVCNVIRRGDIVPTERRFSVDDAKRAKLWGKSGPWSDYPKRMLQMRARAFALRDAFPDVLGGLYLTEEWITDHGDVIDRTPAGTSTLHTQPAVRQADFDDEKTVNARWQMEEGAAIEAPLVTTQHADEHDVGSSSLLDIELPPLSNLRRARRMPRSTLALRFRKQWSIKQPKRPMPPRYPSENYAFAREATKNSAPSSDKSVPPSHTLGSFAAGEQSYHSSTFVPQGDYEACLELFDAALCCANDTESLIEIKEEFSERLKALPDMVRHRSETIFEKHSLRIQHAVSEDSASHAPHTYSTPSSTETGSSYINDKGAS